jgi:hypothetical protein
MALPHDSPTPLTARHARSPTDHALRSFRNPAIGVIRVNGTRKIEEDLEHVAADRSRALPLLADACNRSTR